MPVISCPKCPTKLKIPDGVSGNTRCPKCGTVFPVAPPAFEVVETAPKSAAPKPAPKPAPPPAKPQPKFEVVDKPKKRVTKADEDDDEDEDERPRKKKRADDDDEDDRPRSRKKKRDDDDDDEDDRPRKKKGSGKKKRVYDDDDDGYDDWRPRGGGGEFAKARTGAMLMGVSYWLNLAAYGLLALFVLIAWLAVVGESSGSGSSRGGSSRSSSGDGDGGSFLEYLVILPGLIGLGAWIVGLVGCSFAIAGPRKSRGMAITATVFSAVHLLLVGVTFSNMQEGMRGLGVFAPGMGKVAWIGVASLLPAVDAFLPMLFYERRALDGDYIIALLAGVCEAGRLIFGLLALKALAAAAKDYNASERSGYGVMIVVGVMGGVVLLVLLVAVLLKEGNFKSINTVANLILGTLFLVYLAYSLMMLSPAVAAMGTKDACARKA